MLPLSLEIISIITVLIGIIVNGYILLIVTLTKQIAYVNKILLLHLGVVNTLICFTYLTFYVMSLLNLLVLVDIACLLFGLSFNIMHSVALWNLCALNFDRYFAIASPLHYGALINTKKVLIGLGCGWGVSVLFALPQLLKVSPYHYNGQYEYCLPNFRTTGSLLYNTSLTAFTIFLPIILIFGCNMKVLMIARYQRHRIASAILEVTLSAQLTITHQRNPFFIPSFTSTGQNPAGLRMHAHSPVSNIFQLVGSIIFIYCPYYFCNLWNNIIEVVRGEGGLSGEVKQNVETDLLIPKIVLQASATLLLLSPFANALLYGIKNKVIRKSFHNFWRKQKSKIEIHYEIQARTPSTCGSRRPSINGTNVAQQPLLHRQLSETFLEISKADINNIQSDIKLRSESLWSSNSKLSSYSVLNSPTGNLTTSSLTPGPINANEPRFVYLNPPSTSSSPAVPPASPSHTLEPPTPSTSSGTSKITCNIKSAVKHYSSHSSKPKIKITKTLSEEKQISPIHGANNPLDDITVKVAPSNTKSLFNLGQADDNLLVESTDPIPEPNAITCHCTTRTINSSPFKKYSSLQELSITSTTATICDILK